MSSSRWLATVAIVALSGVASAQEPGAVVTVTVRDSAERPIAEALVALVPHSGPQVRTNDAGVARFVDVLPGAHRVRVIRAGYVPVERQVVVADADTTIMLVMHPTAARLEEVRVIATRTGVFGTVGRSTDWAPVEEAAVTVLGGSTVLTDARGSFAAPELDAGAHMLRIEREGFVTAVRAVMVPDSGAVEIAVLLDSGSTPPGHQRMLKELDLRQTWRGFDSAVIPRGELASYGEATLSAAMRQAGPFTRRGLALPDDPCVYVNGEPRPGWPIDAFSVDQVEAVEVYERRADLTGTLAKRWPPGLPCGAPPEYARPRRRERDHPGTVSFVVIWLKAGARK